jgi:spore coat polysaccharide biosynthesis protein SpsF
VVDQQSIRKVIVFIQARMSSRRLPGKVLLPLGNTNVIGRVIRAVSQCKLIDGVAVVTSVSNDDDLIDEFCQSINVTCYRGSLTDVLQRYSDAIESSGATDVVRITADCPFLDPIIVDSVISGYLSGSYDYYSLNGDFPDGLDVGVISASTLLNVNSLSLSDYYREHVSLYIEHNPSEYSIGKLLMFNKMSDTRITLDTIDDYLLCQEIELHLSKHNLLGYVFEILEFLKNRDQL